MIQEQKMPQEQKRIMQRLDDEFGDTKSYKWKVAICHLVGYYDNVEKLITTNGIVVQKGGDLSA